MPQTCMALLEHLQGLGTHELHICLSQESLQLYTQDASAFVKHSLELQGAHINGTHAPQHLFHLWNRPVGQQPQVLS